MSSYSRQQLEAYLRTVDVYGNVLDIGGSQNPIKGRTKSWSVLNYHIMDLITPHESKAEVDIQFDIESTSFQHYFDETAYSFYDNIFCIEVSEYWVDPLQALYNINHLLKRGGYLYISFHNLYPIHEPEKFDSLRYTKRGVERILEKAGFIIDKIWVRNFNNYQYVKMLYDNEAMRGVGRNKGKILEEQGWLIKAIKV